MSIEMAHLSDCTPAECYVYQYVATWVKVVDTLCVGTLFWVGAVS